MSASQQKKIRQQQREQGIEKHQVAEKKAAKKEHSKKVKNRTLGIIAAVIVIAIILVASNLPYTTFTAVKIGDKSYNAAEYSFYYKTAYMNTMQQFGDYATQLIDTKTPLDKQKYSEDQTWAEFFKQSAIESMKNVAMLCDEAKKEGFTLSEEDQAQLNAALASVETNYDTNSYSNANGFLEDQYGKGVTVDLVKKIYEDNFIASFYGEEKYNSFEYDDGDLENAYVKNADNYDKYTYLSYYADGSVKEDDVEANDDETSTTEATESDIVEENAKATDETASDNENSKSEDSDKDKEDAMASAKSIAENIVASSNSAEQFKSAAKEYADSDVSESTSQGGQLSTNYADWLKDSSRNEGDSTVIESDSGYYAIYFISRENNDYNTVNFRHILCYALPDETGEYTEESKSTAESEAEKIFEEWQNGDATEESFADLANKNSDDTGSNTKGGLYENVSKGSMVPAVNDFIFGEGRKTGDTSIVFNDGSYTGYHILYFSGDGKNYRKVIAENDLRAEDYNNWKTAALENYEAKEGFGAKFVD